MYCGCFLDTTGGRVHLAIFGSLAGRHVWLYLPPFAEEMNLSRAVVARQARAFEARQEAVVCLDYFGTGDSAGTFQQAELAFWLENVRGALEWIEQQGAASVSLWGLRFGGAGGSLLAKAAVLELLVRVAMKTGAECQADAGAVLSPQAG